MDAVRDQYEIRNHQQRWGRRGSMTSAQIHRMASTSGVDVDMVDKMGKAIISNVEFDELYKGIAKDEFADDFMYMTVIAGNHDSLWSDH